VERQPTRADHYMRLPDSEGLNVKMRGGRIEIKQRVGPVDRVCFHERVTGFVEEWHKWSFQLAAPGRARLRTASRASSWIAVWKNRQLRTYRVQDGGYVVARPTPDSPTQGCELELTEVQAAGQVWWTLALEAFGDESRLRDTLSLVAKQIFSADEPPSLEAANSHGYAAWLASMSTWKRSP
jgi:hypothetical protein